MRSLELTHPTPPFLSPQPPLCKARALHRGGKFCTLQHMTLARGVAPEEYYHVFNRGAHRLPIFKDNIDRLRFLFLILYCQSPATTKNVNRIVRRGSAEEGFPVPLDEQEVMIRSRGVELVAFSLMPNHFHLLLKETVEGGISDYMQRVGTAYTMYFNTKYEASGHVFQGRYKSVHVKDNRQLTYLSAYIHRNPRELKDWKDKEEKYPFSSLQDYVDKNRWGNLIVTDIIAEQFAGAKDSNYRDFVRTSTAKMLAEELALPE